MKFICLKYCIKQKILFLTFIIFCFFLSGCGLNDKYKDYKHYDLSNEETNSYTFHYDEGDQTYALAMIPRGETTNTGIYYKIGDNDYILLSEIESCGENENVLLGNNYNMFYKGKDNKAKLFVNRCMGKGLYEYILDGSNIKRKELKYDTSSITSSSLDLYLSEIKKVDENDIYYKATFDNPTPTKINVICSLKNYQCEQMDDE